MDMASYNKIILVGRLTHDPETKFTPTGTQITTFSLAVDRPKREGKEREADFFNIQTWSKLAEVCANYLHKGRMALIEGRLEVQKWEKDGVKHSKNVVQAGVMQILDKREEEQTPRQSSELEQEQMQDNAEELPF
jgi:single-strand DNA-binding protein